MKSKFLLATATASVALLTAACGGSSSPSAGSTSSGAAVATSSAPSAGAATGSTAAATSAGGSATGSAAAGGGDPGSVVVGSADFSESTLLAYVYGDALAAKGVKVSYKVNIGERAAYIAALKDGSISYIPDYSGSLLDFLDPAATAKSPADVATALKPAAAKINLTPLAYAPAQDADTITVTKATAAKYKLTTISSLVPVAGKLTFGAPPNMATRADGVPGFLKVYGLKFGKFTPLAASGLITETALKNGSVDAADIFSTNPSIVENGFVSLQDDKNVFAAQNIVPVVATSKVTAVITSASNAVSAKLTTLELAKLDDQVQGKKMDPQAVAKAWDQANGFL
ncbi:MAG: osmoprotectant transport system substrate-binding protein [Frankiales bacterium]|nr:osmoprotectant transport system substrate-binding protein [Frankiales bacterium]